MLKHRIHAVTTVIQNIKLMSKYGIRVPDVSFQYLSYECALFFFSSLHYIQMFTLNGYKIFIVSTHNK
jgi:hypothetical protein